MIEKNIELDSSNNEAGNKTLATELHFELLKQYSWLSSAVIGAVIILVQLKAVEMGTDTYISLGFLGLSILISVAGQDYIVDTLLKDENILKIAKKLKIARYTSLGLIGIGVGYFIANLS